MSQEIIDARRTIYIDQHVIPTANQMGYAFDRINGILTFYQVNELGIEAAQEITERDVDGYYFSARELHGFHGMLLQLVNMAQDIPVNGGVARRFRNELDIVGSNGYQFVTPETADPILAMKYGHIEACIALADQLEKLIAISRCTLDYDISNGYGVANGRPGFQIDDAFLAPYRFTAKEYNSWIDLLIQADNFFTGDAPVVSGNYVVVNTRIKDPNA